MEGGDTGTPAPAPPTSQGPRATRRPVSADALFHLIKAPAPLQPESRELSQAPWGAEPWAPERHSISLSAESRPDAASAEPGGGRGKRPLQAGCHHGAPHSRVAAGSAPTRLGSAEPTSHRKVTQGGQEGRQVPSFLTHPPRSYSWGQ